MDQVPGWLTWTLGIASVVMFVASLVAIPVILRKLPADYFVRQPETPSPAARVARNVGGVLLIALGIAMLVLPGQGVLAILIGMSIMDLPFKHRALRRLFERPAVRDGLQQLRQQLGAPPFLMPPTAG